MNHVYLGLGSNRGNRADNLNQAIKGLEEKTGKVIVVSSIYETQPWQMDDATSFLNQVIAMDTELSAPELMKLILQLEESMGRVRTKAIGYEPRIIDIDILFYNNDILHCDFLIVPHPQIENRRFVLEPLAEVAPDYVHPSLQKSIKQLLSDCPDKLFITKFVSK
jgi:2-amino-4-hydroxy-6-hydroxymethyldihydropteridine diphosphokinase